MKIKKKIKMSLLTTLLIVNSSYGSWGFGSLNLPDLNIGNYDINNIVNLNDFLPSNISDLLNGGLSDILNIQDLSGLFGFNNISLLDLANIELQCPVEENGNYGNGGGGAGNPVGDMDFDICSKVQNIGSLINRGFNFNFGSCEIGANVPFTEGLLGNVQSICQNIQNNVIAGASNVIDVALNEVSDSLSSLIGKGADAIREIGGDELVSSVQELSKIGFNAVDMVTSTTSYITNASDKISIYQNRNICSEATIPNSHKQKISKYSEILVKTNNRTNSPKNYFTYVGSLQEDCIRNMYNSGLSEEAIVKICSDENVLGIPTKDESEIIAQENEIIRKTLSPTSVSMIDKDIEQEFSLKNGANSQCGNESSLSGAMQCEKNYYDNNFKPQERSKVIKEEIQMKNAIENSLADKATMEKYKINLPTKDIYTALPNGLKKPFSFISYQYFMQEAVISHFESEIERLEEEVANLDNLKIKVCSSNFYAKPVMKEIDNQMKNLGVDF